MSGGIPASGRDRLLWGVLIAVLGSVFLLTAWSRLRSSGGSRAELVPREPSAAATVAVDYGQVPDFQLTERSGRGVGRSDLLGKVWVAGFIFTRCPGPCLKLSAAMAGLQGTLNASDFRLVTVTVDPRHDTPAVLAAYAERYKADTRRWLFLTGERAPIYSLIHDGFKLGVEDDSAPGRSDGGGISHSTKLVLVDRAGRIRGYFDSDDPAELAGLLRKARKLIEEPS